MLTYETLTAIANWQPAVDDWPDECSGGNAFSRYERLVERLKSIPGLSSKIRDTCDYGETFFEVLLYRPQPQGNFDGTGLSIALSRFAPIGIYSEQRRKWFKDGGGSQEYPSLAKAYAITCPEWKPVGLEVRVCMQRCGIFLPTVDELSAPIFFPYPKEFWNDAIRTPATVFDIVFNDVY